MRYIQTIGFRVFILAALFLVNSVRAQSGYAVTERGADWKVLQKTTVEHGTNYVHRYTELATGMNYTNASGQLVESKEQITILPTGGAAAVQGQHKVYFPANIYNGVIEVVTPDGKHLKSRPLGVSYDDGSNTVFIAELKSAVGYLTASNQVTYRDAFTGFKADLVCTYRRGGFESDLVFRQQPQTPGDYGLDESFSTLQLVTEFFNTADPQQINAGYDDYFGLQDTTLKFGNLTMTHGKAFRFNATNANSQLPSPNSSSPVYKSWVHAEGRTFLIEIVPVLDIADDLNALPLTAKVDTKTKTLFASRHREFPPAHGFVSDTNQVLIAALDLSKEPGVVLDYNTVDSDRTDYTFESNTTYSVTGFVNLDGTTTFEGGAVIKFRGDGVLNLSGPVVCATTPYQPAIFTSKDDDSVGQALPDSTGNPLAGAQPDYIWSSYGGNVQMSHVRFYYAGGAVSANAGYYVSTEADFNDAQFVHCSYGFFPQEGGGIVLNNALVSDCLSLLDGGYVIGNNVTFDHCDWGIIYAGNAYLTNCVFADVTNIVWDGGGDAGIFDGSGDYELSGSHNGFFESSLFGDDQAVSGTNPFQPAANAKYYLATSSPYRNAGTTNINPDLLAELRTMTTYAPQDGGMPDTNAPDLGYHYPVNEDSDHDGLPDAWEWEYFASYAYSGTNQDVNGNTFLDDYNNGADPNIIQFTVRLGNQHFNNTNATGSFLVLGGMPGNWAILVNSTNLSSAIWTNYTGTNFTFNLGPTDGVYQVWFGLKGIATNAAPSWMGTAVYLDRIKPALIISSPTNRTVATSYVQLQGYASESLLSVTFNLTNSVVVVTNELGFKTGNFFDTNRLDYTTNYFQCYDIPLAAGSNIITLQATDLAGNMTATNLNITMDYAAATNPIIQLTWPQNGAKLNCGSFTLRGWTDDAISKIAAQIVNASGETNFVNGLVERDGKIWVNNLPLSEGTNQLTLCVTNAAGLVGITNISLVKGSLLLTMEPPGGNLWLPTTTVTGHVGNATYAVWVNGVKASVQSNGVWTATNVPVSSGGMAAFDMTAYAPDEVQPDGSYGN